jgi:hypothetical protein
VTLRQAQGERQVKELRDRLLSSADKSAAVAVANKVIDEALETFNGAGTNVATQLLGRALAARAILMAGAFWWSDVSQQPRPLTWRALRELVDDLPIGLRDDCFVDPSIPQAKQ